MAERFLDQRWPWLVAAGAIGVVFLSSVVEINLPGDWDSRPLGSIEDIEALADREDLNLLFVVIDTLRAERLGSYGYERGPRRRWPPSGWGSIPPAPVSRASTT
jgi:hypothetical protein